MTMDSWFVIRATGNQATSVVGGPIDGKEAIALWGRASAAEDSDDSQVICIPAGVVNDMLQAVGVLV